MRISPWVNDLFLSSWVNNPWRLLPEEKSGQVRKLTPDPLAFFFAMTASWTASPRAKLSGLVSNARELSLPEFIPIFIGREI
jgi:hypothetical protein